MIIRDRFNARPALGELNEGSTLTEIDQSLTVREILYQMEHGLMPDVVRPVYYDDDYDSQIDAILDNPELDRFDRINLTRQFELEFEERLKEKQEEEKLKSQKAADETKESIESEAKED